MRDESFVKVTEEVIENPVALNTDDSIQIGGVIIAPTGPDVALVSKPSEFLSLYTTSGELPRNADQTLLNAYYLLQSTSMVLARAINTEIHGGLIVSGTPSTDASGLSYVTAYTLTAAYFDKNNQVIRYKLSSDYLSFEFPKSSLNSSIWAAWIWQFNDVIMYYGDYPTIDDLSEYTVVECSSITDVISTLGSLGGVYLANVSTTYEEDDVEGQPTSISFDMYSLEEGVISYSGIASDTTTIPGSSTDSVELQLSIYYESYSEEDGITYGESWLLIGDTAYYFDEDNIPSIEGVSNYILLSSYDEVPGIIEDTFYGFTVISTEYELTETKVNITILATVTETIESTTLISGYGEDYYNITVTKGPDSTSEETSTFSYDKIEDTTIEYEAIAEISDTELFYIINDNVDSSNRHSVKISGISGNKNRLYIISNPDSSLEGSYYDFSLKMDQTDSAGTNIYITYLNDQELGVTIVVCDEETSYYGCLASSVTRSFGKTLGYSASSSKTLPYVTTALTKLEEQELYDIDGLCLLGLQECSDGAQITRLFVTEGPDHKWFTPVGVPRAYTNRRTIYNWANALDLPEPDPMPGCIILGPFDRNTSLVDWACYIDPGCKYWERVVANKSLKKEFAPVFATETGVMNMADPCLELQKTDRNVLLNKTKPVNWICYDARSGVYYLNQNWTWQSNTGIITEEEQITRQIWKISRDVDPILRQFFAKQNTKTTRQQAIDLVEYYLQWNIMNQQFAPVEYKITCDTTNNTDADINNHLLNFLLEVRYQGSIKWVYVINRAYPLGVDFTNEM